MIDWSLRDQRSGRREIAMPDHKFGHRIHIVHQQSEQARFTSRTAAAGRYARASTPHPTAMIAATAATQPHPGPRPRRCRPRRRPALPFSAGGPAALRPSVIRMASPSSSRSDGRRTPAGPRGRTGGQGDFAETACACEPPDVVRGRPMRPGMSGGRARHPATASRLAAAISNAGASLLALEANAICARSRSAWACWSSSSGPAAGVVTSSAAASSAPACRLACAAARARPTCRAGSGGQLDRALQERRRRGHAAAGPRPPR